MMSIHINPLFFSEVIGEEYEQLPRTYRHLVEGKGSGCLNRSMPITPMLRVALEQILNCPFENGSRRLYCEGKAMEIIACMLKHLKTSFPARQAFCAADIDRIHHAEDLLTRDISDPPGLMDLARSVGMHHSKLNKGFREAFHNTVFGRLREIRLEKARHHLETGDMNCAEAAFSVGYSSLSHFAKAFKEQYGTNPGLFIKRVSPVNGNSRRH